MMRPTKALLGHKALLSIAVLYTVAITIASLAPTNELPKITYEFADKWAHLFIHALLFYVWATAVMMLKGTHLSWKTMGFLLLACLSYGIIIEVLQEICTTYRRADVLDVVANALGSFIGFVVILVRRKLISN